MAKECFFVTFIFSFVLMIPFKRPWWWLWWCVHVFSDISIENRSDNDQTRCFLSLSLSLARSKRWRSQPDVDMDASIRPTGRVSKRTWLEWRKNKHEKEKEIRYVWNLLWRHVQKQKRPTSPSSSCRWFAILEKITDNTNDSIRYIDPKRRKREEEKEKEVTNEQRK